MQADLTRRTWLKGTAAWGATLLTKYVPRRARAAAGDAPRLRAVQQFADTVLEQGRDTYGPAPTPLLVDGLNIETRQPVRWVHRGEAWICSNLASQQNLFRTLVGLSRLIGQERYRETAAAAVSYHFEQLVRSCGLLQWGGHRFYDAATGRFVGEQDTHELKCSYPFFEFLYEVDAAATRRYIESLWNAHILDWNQLDMNRHGRYGLQRGRLWDHEFGGFQPFFEGRGLTFVNTGSDLYYAAALLHALTGAAEPLRWGSKLMEYYVRARDPDTGLGAYQYSQLAGGRDRAKVQLGPEFGEVALEGKVLDPGRASVIYGRAGVCQMRIAELAGAAGADFLRWTCEGLRAYAQHAYDPETNQVRALFTDGTPLAPEDVVRSGYYRPSVFQPQTASPLLLFAFAMAHRQTGDEALWSTVRAMAQGHGLGDWGTAPGRSPQPELDTATADPYLLFAVLETVQACPEPLYLDLARRLADNLLEQRFHEGLFRPSARHRNASFDTVEPLALLTLEALLRDERQAIPLYPAGRGFIHGPHDGLGRTYDHMALWGRTRDESP